MTAEVEFRRDGGLGRVTLRRPRAINALTPGMVDAMHAALSGWMDDPAVVGVLIEGEGERGLCAGGDIRFLHDCVRAGQTDQADAFLRHEYRLNARIARLPKPFVAIMDGLVMGGGVGVSAHGSVRIVTERTRLAMPEAGIGFLPDVGATFLLATAPGECGTHAALTGEAMGAADAISCGLADHHVRSDRLPGLVAELVRCRSAAELEACVAARASPPAPGWFAQHGDWIGSCYRLDAVDAILQALQARPEPEAQAAAERINRNAPMSLVVTLRALRRGRRFGRLERCMDQEYQLGTGLIRRPDFIEGVRAAVIDKDRNPRWQPATLAGVDPEEVERLFNSTLTLDLPSA